MPTCTSVAALIASQPCFGSQNLNGNQRKALLIWFMANELSVIGGTNYTALLSTTLVSDAVSFAGQATSPPGDVDRGSQFDQARLAIAYNNAVAAGAALATDIDELMASIAPLSKATERMLDSILIMLECKLGQHATQ